MSDFTIEQLEALKEGTTPGPWLITPHQNPVGIEATRWYGIPMERANADLAEAAPALVDALIAEKQARQKLRSDVEALLESYTISRDSERRKDKFSTVPLPAVYDKIHDHLTRILEADNE